MSDLVNVQKEFEELISQLEKLKTVNEITSTNTESSKKVIEELHLFVEKTESYIEKSHKNYESTDKKINDTVDDLKKSIRKFEDESAVIKQNVEKKIAELSKQTENTLNNNTQEIKSNFEEIFDLVNKVAKNQTALGVNLKSNLEKRQAKIDSLSQGLRSRISQQDEELKFLKVLLYCVVALMVIGFGGLLFLGLN